MMHETVSRSIPITLLLLLGLTALGSAQNVKRKQQAPRGIAEVPATSPASPAERRIALVIGNAAYQYTAPLSNPVNDAQDMARVLTALQFQVLLKTDATHDTMAEAIFEFGEQLKRGGVGLLYYSGHRIQVQGENYLIPIDANVMHEDDIKRTAIHAKDVLDTMGAARNRLNLVFLDACRDNPFPQSVRAAARGLASMHVPAGMLLAFAANPDHVAAYETGRNGTYTKHLLHYMTQPGLEILMLLRKIRIAVKEETGGQQVPWETTSMEGDFYFAGSSHTAQVVVPQSFGSQHVPAAPVPIVPSQPPVVAALPMGTPHRLALVIGNSAYLKQPLANPINDANAIARFLANEAGFTVYKGRALTDVDRQTFLTALSDFANSIRRGDTVVFYFSGHGLERNGNNYLIPTNFAAPNAAQLPYEAPTAQDIQKQLVAAEPNMMMMILDACRDLPEAFKSLQTRSVGGGLGSMSTMSRATAQQVVMFATAAGTTASDGGTLGNGTFTYCFLQSFRRSGIDSRIAFGDVVQCVLDKSNQEQSPFLVTSQRQPFVFK